MKTKLTDAQVSQLNKAIGDGINAQNYMSITLRRATIPFAQKRIRDIVESGEVTFSDALSRIKELLEKKT